MLLKSKPIRLEAAPSLGEIGSQARGGYLLSRIYYDGALPVMLSTSRHEVISSILLLLLLSSSSSSSSPPSLLDILTIMCVCV